MQFFLLVVTASFVKDVSKKLIMSEKAKQKMYKDTATKSKERLPVTTAEIRRKLKLYQFMFIR